MTMEATFLLIIGGILLMALAVDALGQKTKLPRVTLLLIFGIIIGNEGFGLIPESITSKFELISDMALLMVGFLIGGKINIDFLKKSGKETLWISMASAIITTIIVTIGLYFIGIDLELAIILGCIASATAPAAVVDVILESKYKGKFADLLVSIVALDDAWGLILFSFGLAIASIISGNGNETTLIITVFKEIGGALFLGILIGFPASYLTGRIQSGEPSLMEALGLVFVLGGVAIFFEVSFLIAAITMGFIVTNFAKHHDYPFHAIEGIEWPFMSIFFVLAGVLLDLSALLEVGFIGAMYILFRIIGKIIGTRIGCEYSSSDIVTKKWMGVSLLPQAGVAIGMALVASHSFPQYSQVILPIVIGSTIFFEIIGPIFAKKALDKAKNEKNNN